MPKGIPNNGRGEGVGNSVFEVTVDERTGEATVKRLPIGVEIDGVTFYTKSEHVVDELAGIVTKDVEKRYKRRDLNDTSKGIRAALRKGDSGVPVTISLDLADYLPQDEDEDEFSEQAAAE